MNTVHPDPSAHHQRDASSSLTSGSCSYCDLAGLHGQQPRAKLVRDLIVPENGVRDVKFRSMLAGMVCEMCTEIDGLSGDGMEWNDVHLFVLFVYCIEEYTYIEDTHELLASTFIPQFTSLRSSSPIRIIFPSSPKQHLSNTSSNTTTPQTTTTNAFLHPPDPPHPPPHNPHNRLTPPFLRTTHQHPPY